MRVPRIPIFLNWARTSYDSIRGRIATDWKLDGDTLLLKVSVPPNTTATVHVPTSDPASVTEGGKSVEKAEGVKVLRDGVAVFAVGSGRYAFRARK